LLVQNGNPPAESAAFARSARYRGHRDAHVKRIAPRLGPIPGDLGLSRFEDKLSDAWPRCHNRDEPAFRTMTAFHRLIQAGAAGTAELVLIDIGPNLGAVNRATSIASDQVSTPRHPIFSRCRASRALVQPSSHLYY
jgi:cellulose biosynthesis protein BcsQ